MMKTLFRRRRKSFTDESDFVKDFYEKQVQTKGSDGGGHRYMNINKQLNFSLSPIYELLEAASLLIAI